MIVLVSHSEIAVTVLLPVYNAQYFLRTAIKSILLQTHGNFELLIIDDGSTDKSAEIIKSFTDERIRYIKVEHNGLSKALNIGLTEAKYDIVARMDADDISVPNRIELQIAKFSKLPYNTVLSCGYVLFSERDKYTNIGADTPPANGITTSSTRYVWGLADLPATHEEITRSLPLHNVINHAGVMYNRKFILENGGYAIQPIEDYELWLRLKAAASFAIIPAPLMAILYRGNSLSRARINESNAIIYNLTKELFENTALLFSMGILPKEVNGLRGWREYFYGSKTLAREYWIKSFSQNNLDARSVIGFCTTYLPDDLFRRFKESRYRFRLNYYREKSSPEIRSIESFLREL